MINVPKRITTNFQSFFQFWNSSGVASGKFAFGPYIFCSHVWYFFHHSLTDPTEWSCEETKLEVRWLNITFEDNIRAYVPNNDTRTWVILVDWVTRKLR